MSETFYYILHVTSVLLLSGVTFSALADPEPERKKRHAMLSGILSLLVLTGGFGLMARLGYGIAGWILIKLVLWLALSAMAALAFRMKEKRGLLIPLTAVLFAGAVVTVYLKPMHASVIG
ncbi:MAG: hypothetical protein ACYS26_18895 [Planctomycetota bacterium]|jgi:uncharacterized membrane protein SirB2